MDEDQYTLVFFKKENGRKPALEYLLELPKKDRTKISDSIRALAMYAEFRQEPNSRHLVGKLRELRVDFSHNRYRVVYFFQIGKVIIVLHIFNKKTQKTPRKDINRAIGYMNEFLENT